MQVKLPAERLLPSTYHTNNTDASEGFGQGGRQGRRGWGRLRSPGLALRILGLCWNRFTELTGLRGSAVLKAQGGSKLIFCYWRFPQGKQSVVKRRQDSTLPDVLYSFCLLTIGYTVRIKDPKLSKLVFLLCNINWMVAPLERRKAY